MARFTVSSLVAAPPAEVWRRVSTPEGVNQELMPFVRMRFPKEMQGRSLADAQSTGGAVGRCWLLLFGVLPVDWDDVRLVRVEPGRGFLERSTMLTQSLWQHERTLEAEGQGTRVTDAVEFTPRVPGIGWFLLPLFRAVFAHRHRRLRRWFAKP